MIRIFHTLTPVTKACKNILYSGETAGGAAQQRTEVEGHADQQLDAGLCFVFI